MSKPDTWMPFYVGDYLKDTGHLERHQDGGYLLLLFAAWSRAGKLTNDDAQLARLAKATPAEWKRLRPVLAPLFVITPEFWIQPRLLREYEASIARKEKAEAKAKTAALARWNGDAPSIPASNAPSNQQAMHEECPSPSPSSLTTKSKAKSSSAETNPPNIDGDPLPNVKTESREQARKIIGFLNEKTGRNFRMVDANLKPIMARMKEGATVRDLRAVVARKCRDWSGDEKMAQYLRPETLFNATKFAQYVGEVPPQPQQG